MNPSQARKLELLTGIGAFGTLILVIVLSWPLGPFFAYYLSLPRWGFWVISITGLGLAIIYGKSIWKNMKIPNLILTKSQRRTVLACLIIAGSVTGIGFLMPQLYLEPELVDLESFDSTGWEHFNQTKWDLNKDAYRNHLLQCWGDFPEMVSLDPVLISEEDCGDYLRVKMQITVENSGRNAWDYMRFYILIPDQPITTPTPCMIVFHQHDGAFSKGKEEPVGLMRDPRQAFALELVKQGFIAVAPDALCFSERQELSEYKTSKMLQTYNRTLNGKYVWDIARLVDYLGSRPDIDASRIGIMGHSLGGQMAIYCAAYDSRLALMISNCGFGKINGTNSVLEYNGEENEAFYLPGLASGPNPMDMKEIIGLIDKPIVLANGINDLGLPINGVAEIHNWIEEKYNNTNQSSNCITIRFNAAHGIYPNCKQIMYNFAFQKLG